MEKLRIATDCIIIHGCPSNKEKAINPKKRTYNKHRHRFSSLHEWINWHNNRLTTALDIEHYETPNDAFIRKLPNLLSLFFKRLEK